MHIVILCHLYGTHLKTNDIYLPRPSLHVNVKHKWHCGVKRVSWSPPLNDPLFLDWHSHGSFNKCSFVTCENMEDWSTWVAYTMLQRIYVKSFSNCFLPKHSASSVPPGSDSNQLTKEFAFVKYQKHPLIYTKHVAKWETRSRLVIPRQTVNSNEVIRTQMHY